MKRTLFHLTALIAGLGLLPTGRVAAQTFTTLHSFATASGSSPSGVPYTNVGGAWPYGTLILSGETLYGTTEYGSTLGWGVVFSLKTDGTGFTNLHRFNFSNGASPHGGLVLSGNTLYGTTTRGGNPGFGTVFAINTDGTGFTNLYVFTPTGPFAATNSDGAYPNGKLLLSGNSLYGTAYWGGSSGNGTVFAVNTDGTGFTNLHNFGPPYAFMNGTNGDGANPWAGLILSSNVLYGTAQYGGSLGKGTVFALNTDGTGFTNLHNFTGGSGGAAPVAGLILSGNSLYGTALSGGASVFALNTDGTGFTNLHSLTGSDGSNPWADLILSGNALYGTAALGGSSGNGTMFALNTDGTGFTTVYSFTPFTSLFPDINNDGAGPEAGLILSGNTLYGTAKNGGAGGGTVFSLSFAPQLTIRPFGANVVLTWPTNYAGFDYTGFALQSAPASTGTFTNLPGATSPYTNPISGAQQFFRLISN